MDWKRCSFALLISMFLFVPIAIAQQQFYAEIQPINDAIYEDESASFYLRIINNLMVADEYRIYTLDYPLWSIYSEPGMYSVTATVGAKSDETITVFVEPISATPGIHAVNLKVRSRVTDKVISVPATVTLRHPAGSKQYVPTVLMDITVPKNINPKDSVPIKIDLNNQNPLNIPELRIKIESDNGLFEEIIEPGIQPKETKTVEYTQVLDPQTQPQLDVWMFSLLRGNETITGPVKKNVEIIKYSTIVPNIDSVKRFLKTDNNIIFTNEGNIPYSGKLKLQTTFVNSLFTSANPRAKVIKEDGKRYLSWEANLGPAEQYLVYVTLNFRSLVLILILMVATGVLYYLFRSPLIIKKMAPSVEKGPEGGVESIKVMIHVSNRGKNSIKELELTEKIPDLVEVKKEITIGTLQPDKILRHEKKGMLLKWNIRELESGEERVITYSVRSKLSILGEFVLPPMTAHFKFMGREVKSHSNRLYLNS